MKVKELIAKLQEFDGELEVLITSDYIDTPVFSCELTAGDRKRVILN